MGQIAFSMRRLLPSVPYNSRIESDAFRPALMRAYARAPHSGTLGVTMNWYTAGAAIIGVLLVINLLMIE